MDDRRRRRLAVHGDGSGDASTGDLRAPNGDLSQTPPFDSELPGLPAVPWKIGLFASMPSVAVAVLLAWMHWLHSQQFSPVETPAAAVSSIEQVSPNSGQLSALADVQTDLPATPGGLQPVAATQLEQPAASLESVGEPPAALETSEGIPSKFSVISKQVIQELNQAQPRFIEFTLIACWLCMAQLAVFIGWRRKQSQLDFQGRFRMWSRAAVLAAGWAFFLATNLHPSLARIVTEANPSPVWNAATMFWLAPVTIVGLGMATRLDHDMRRCKTSRYLFQAGAILLVMGGITQLLTFNSNQAHLESLWRTTFLLAGTGLLASSLWVHSWFVAYRNADPDVSTLGPSRLVRFGRFLKGWFTSRKAAEGVTEETSSEEVQGKRKVVAESAAAKTRKKRATRSKTAEIDEEESVVDSSDEEEAQPVDETEDYSQPVAAVSNRPASAQKASEPEPQSYGRSDASTQHDAEESWEGDDNSYRVDGPSKDMFKGLSKRQRRELQRQMKEKQRSERE